VRTDAGHRIDIIDTDKLAARQTVKNVGGRVCEYAQRHVNRAIPGLVTCRLQQVRLTRGRSAPKPDSLPTRGGHLFKGRNQRLVSFIKETIKYGIVRKTQRQGHLGHS
jgi:hypothetical protein